MNTSIILELGILIILLVLLILSYLLCTKYVFPYLNKKNELKEKEIKNKKYELFMDVNPSRIEEELDKYFERFVKRYIAYKFIANKITYINSEEIEIMVKELTKLVTIDISELYTFYMTMITSIDTTEDMIRYINIRIKNITIDTVSNYNKSEQLLSI